MIHNLKTWPEYFIHVRRGWKCFEIRKDDREFQIGDYLKLQEWCPRTKTYTGQEITRQVNYIYRGDMVAPGYCVLGL